MRGTGGGAGCLFAVELLPGQFDQRASSAAECIQIISRGERPAVKTAKVYALYGNISDDEAAAVKKICDQRCRVEGSIHGYAGNP